MLGGTGSYTLALNLVYGMITFSFCILVFGAVQMLIFLHSNKAMGFFLHQTGGDCRRWMLLP